MGNKQIQDKVSVNPLPRQIRHADTEAGWCALALGQSVWSYL